MVKGRTLVVLKFKYSWYTMTYKSLIFVGAMKPQLFTVMVQCFSSFTASERKLASRHLEYRSTSVILLSK